ncbi:B3 domain-containing transcription factor LEC2-like isoform X2 [Mangifera indica]|uniref:B3 domain-containing transcription factor LEC2-like isoform X2 n=1 Tax=Mangifera indica TaxID=29780 RepID=UPI001CFA264D|nr:B3 domain-containing transcription factor LEC2-like isoform X2 [Mangifera indica]
MANNFSSLPRTTATTDINSTNTSTIMNLRQTNMPSSQNSQFSNPEPVNFPPTLPTTLPQYILQPQYMQPFHQSMQFSCPYPLEQAATQSFVAYPVYPVWFGQNEIGIGAPNVVPSGSCFWQPNNGVVMEQQRGSLDPQKTKIARTNRKLARQRNLILQRNASSGSSSIACSSTHMNARRLAMYSAENINNNRDQYNFCTPDNKRLRVLLKKELKNSDVGSLGRIVLPKREAEENLPILSDKEGIQVVMRDAFSEQFWTLKFKYWCNNRSRMYVLENTGEFVRQNRLQIGDSLTLYEDENKSLYFSITKVENQTRPEAESSSFNQHYINQNNTYNYHTQITPQARDEEEASLALLIEQLQHKEQQEAYNLMALPMESSSSSYRQLDEASNSTSNNITNTGIHPYSAEAAAQLPSLSRDNISITDDHQNNSSTDDCYGGLGMLPDVNQYNFLL